MSKNTLSVLFGIFIYSSCVFAKGNLIFAIDMVRHGDRTPMIASPEMQKIWPQGLGQLTPKGMRQEYEERFKSQSHLPIQAVIEKKQHQEKTRQFELER